MSDYRLKVFYTVAKRLNFTKAAEELFISQPAVTKHIKELEQEYTCKLFERNGSKINLTLPGKIFLNYAEKIFAVYRELGTAIEQLDNANRGQLLLGISTTAAQYILPKYIALFQSNFPNMSLTALTNNTENIENLLVKNKIDLGIVEGQTKRTGLTYTPFLKDEIVLCTNFNTLITPIISINQLKTLKFVFREQGSGSLEIINAALRKNKINPQNLKSEIILENNESIKNYLHYSDCFAFISIYAITEELKTHKLKVIEIENLAIERYYSFVRQQGESLKAATLFVQFSMSHNFKL